MTAPARLMCSDGLVEDHQPMQDEPLSFDCPRCATPTSRTYYGLCKVCSGTLRATMWTEPRLPEGAGYEPKMNVTPNAVATKE